jgi:hypothetical protein
MADALNPEDIFFEPEGGATPEAPEPVDEQAAAKVDDPAETPEEAIEEASAEEQPDGEEQAEEESEEEQETFTVKINGVEEEVTLDDLLGGYQRNKDYTEKTKALAAERRTMEAESNALVQQLQAALSQWAVPQSGEPNPADFDGDNESFVQAYSQWKEQEQRQAQAAGLLQQITQAQHEQTVARERDLLIEKIPEWQDPQAMASEWPEMAQAAIDNWGFTPEELDGATDHRMILLLRDAIRGREVAQKPVVMQRSKAVQPKLKPGSSVKNSAADKRLERANAQLRKTGETDDPAAIFFDG